MLLLYVVNAHSPTEVFPSTQQYHTYHSEYNSNPSNNTTVTIAIINSMHVTYMSAFACWVA